MRVVVQRVTEAQVQVDNETVGRIEKGLLLLVGIAPTDTPATLEWMVRKVVDLRIFKDADQKMNLSVKDIDGGIMAVSQFTLYGDARKGRRPSFTAAAQPEIAEPLFDVFIELLREQHSAVATGTFGASMQVSLTNDGPVTLIIERA